jgi:2-polyprenyl-3-methyl-5-hydroxy-6-metoxy-1,4-benzoquinol methylase
MNKNTNVFCPICSNSTSLEKDLPSSLSRDELSKYSKVKLNNNIEIIDYQMFKCNECSYEFAFPQIEGSNSFYNFVTAQQSYYTSTRWEYGKMHELLPNEDINLLDVGCGDGKFFDHLIVNGKNKLNLSGIDTTMQTVQTCLNKGYKVYCMDIQSFKEQYPGQLFDAIVSFIV